MSGLLANIRCDKDGLGVGVIVGSVVAVGGTAVAVDGIGVEVGDSVGVDTGTGVEVLQAVDKNIRTIRDNRLWQDRVNMESSL